MLNWLSPYAYTLFLTHVFTFTFFTRGYLELFPMPRFFGVSGILYIAGMMLTAIAVSIFLKKAWDRIRARAVASA